MSLAKALPWTKVPLIVNAPMAGSATPPLAIAVSKAGGLGQIGALNDISSISNQLSTVAEALPRHNGLLPVGVGLISFLLHSSLDRVVATLAEHRPAVTWLFAAQDLSHYAGWTTKLRAALPSSSQVWIQVGSVASALRIAREARPDVLVVQGIDAGGHGLEKGAGVISLLPEVADALAAEGMGDIPLVAAGGIVDGRGGAAALALGAQGIVMGTRFLAAPETAIHPGWRRAVLAARDGGQATVRAKVFDEVRGPNLWPGEYDGRSLRTGSYLDHVNGMGVDELRRLHAEAAKTEAGGFGEGAAGRATTWAGTGVGLVQKEQPAGEIVEEVRSGIVKALERAESQL